MKRINVFCGSHVGNDPSYPEMARAVAIAIVKAGFGVVYGGGGVGLMRIVADAALAAGGEVVGVIPHALARTEMAHQGLTELHLVSTMHERKQMMEDLSDAFIALPGGFGTMDEGFEVLTLVQTGKSVPTPIVMVDSPGGDYWRQWQQYVQDQLIRRGLAGTDDLRLYKITDNVDEAVAVGQSLGAGDVVQRGVLAANRQRRAGPDRGVREEAS